MFRLTKRGNLCVEAAIILPLMIIGILTVGYLIKVHSINQDVMNIALDETRILAIESYTNIGKAKSAGFSKQLITRITDENKAISQVRMTDYRYLKAYGGLDNLICFNINYNIDLPFPINFYGNLSENEVIVTRGFVGSNQYNGPMSPKEMETEEESDPVWIFPNQGKKYHQKNCPYIAVAATQEMLNLSIRKKYQPCKICKPSKLPNGSTVYCFRNSGYVYHQGNCYIVDRYVVEIEKTEAINRHYSACLKCGG